MQSSDTILIIDEKTIDQVKSSDEIEDQKKPNDDKTDQIGNWLDGTNNKETIINSDTMVIDQTVNLDDQWDQVLGIYEQNRNDQHNQKEDKKQEEIKEEKRIKPKYQSKPKLSGQRPQPKIKTKFEWNKNEDYEDDYGEEYEYEDYYH